MIAEIYGVMRDGLGMTPKACAEVFEELEQRSAQFLPDRDHRARAGRRRPQDRQAAGRDHPRQRRPEGHRQLVGHRGAADRRAGDRDRGRRRRPLHLVTQGRARRRRGHLWQAQPPARPTSTLADLEKALLAGKIVSYAQGFAVIAKASRGKRLEPAAGHDRQDLARRLHHPLAVSSTRWPRPMPRAQRQPAHGARLRRDHEGRAPALRNIVAAAAVGEFPMICLSASLGYFDSYRQAPARPTSPGPARFLRRPRFRADRLAGRAARHLAENAREVTLASVYTDSIYMSEWDGGETTSQPRQARLGHDRPPVKQLFGANKVQAVLGEVGLSFRLRPTRLMYILICIYFIEMQALLPQRARPGAVLLARRSMRSKPWAPKKSRCAWIRLAVPRPGGSCRNRRAAERRSTGKPSAAAATSGAATGARPASCR